MSGDQTSRRALKPVVKRAMSALLQHRQPMGSSACRFRRPISGKHVAARNGRTFQVALRHSTCDRDDHCRS